MWCEGTLCLEVHSPIPEASLPLVPQLSPKITPPGVLSTHLLRPIHPCDPLVILTSPGQGSALFTRTARIPTDQETSSLWLLNAVKRKSGSTIVSKSQPARSLRMSFPVTQSRSASNLVIISTCSPLRELNLSEVQVTSCQWGKDAFGKAPGSASTTIPLRS